MRFYIGPKAIYSALIVVIWLNVRLKQSPSAPVKEPSAPRAKSQSYQPKIWKTNQERSDVILLSYARSGSSFLAELLTADDNAVYVYEPLLAVDALHKREYSDTLPLPSEVSEVEDLVMSLFQCEKTAIKKAARVSRHKNIPILRKGIKRNCRDASVFLQKTIRLHKTHFVLWMNNINTKIIHLVRDPRAVFHSMMRDNYTWAYVLNATDDFCRTLNNDVDLEMELDSKRYRRLKYEDLVRNPKDQLRKLYNFMGVKYSKKVDDLLHAHTHSNISQGDADHLYETYRGRDFDPLSWKSNLSEEMKEQMLKSCMSAIDRLEYPRA